MITFYVTSQYWEGNSVELLDYTKMSELDIAKFIGNHPNSLVMIKPSGFDCVFRSIFIAKNLDGDGYLKEGVYQTKLNGVDIDFRILVNINMSLARQTHKISHGDFYG